RCDKVRSSCPLVGIVLLIFVFIFISEFRLYRQVQGRIDDS
ncbi:MAG: hypothetical protein RLZZ04_4803, partial [Cyanobacteriota bacterium]